MTAMPSAAWDLAGRAADRIVGRRADRSVQRAVLAQWIAEHGYQWPFSRNNPGNLARSWANAFPFRFTWTTPNPQPGNPIVTFDTLADGADCYAAGLIGFDRYARAVQAARAGDGLDFVTGVCLAGYGTSLGAVRLVYADLEAPGSPGPGVSPGGTDVTIRYSPVTATANRMALRQDTPLYDRPGGSVVTRMSRDATVPHVGLATPVGGHAWRAVIVGTRVGYVDGQRHPTVLYVPATAGEVRVP